MKTINAESKFRLKENVEITVRDARGRFVRRQRIANKVTATGRNLVRDILGGLPWAPTHMAVGTSTTAAADSDTALLAETYRDVITRRIRASQQITFQLFIPTGSGNGNTLAEAALIYVQGSSSTLFARATYTPIVKTAAVSVTITWYITITSS